MIAATSSSPSETDIARDVNGYSSAFRIAQYTSKLIKSTGVFDHASRERKGITCKYIAQVIQLASDDIGVPGSMPLWEYSDPGLENEMVDFVADIQSLLLSWLRNMDRTLSDFVSDAQSQLLNESRGLTATSYYSGRAYCMMTMEVVELHGAKASIDPIGQIKALRTSPDVFTAAAYLTSTSESQELLRLCNHLLTDLTGHDFSENMNEGTSRVAGAR